ncbi:bZIP transcription factor 11-like [Salvia splendens]|uniref:bZIP transcription factor 11-like n=1 Tax=Salvia splendens TaxID=180675 RepID=UPI001C263772|nr:bZIP transcription factor 11-like [Salvia splendens]
MLSTFPASFPGDALLGNPFEPGFYWDNHDLPFFFNQQDEPVVFSHELDPVSSNSGSPTQNPACSSGSDDQDPDKFNKKRSGCGKTVLDDRKRRRMMSNRESARRSRMRKQKHLENLRNQANRLKVGNREQMNRLRFIVCQTRMFRGENERLRNEAVVLRQRLWDIRQVLVVRQLQQIMNPMQMLNNHPTL